MDVVQEAVWEDATRLGHGDKRRYEAPPHRRPKGIRNGRVEGDRSRPHGQQLRPGRWRRE